MKKFTYLLTLSAILLPDIAKANDCGIWLCLPMGFPTSCESAKKSFKKRILKGKSPLPSLSSCTDSSSPAQNLISRHGYAAYIPARKVCIKSEVQRRNNGDYDTVCVESELKPAHAIKGDSCVITREQGSSPIHTPQGCTKTIRYADTILNGQQYGETYYYDSSGNSIHFN